MISYKTRNGQEAVFNLPKKDDFEEIEINGALVGVLVRSLDGYHYRAHPIGDAPTWDFDNLFQAVDYLSEMTE